MNLISLQHLVRAVRTLAENCEVALDPHDLAATKLLVGRAKDIALVSHLGRTGRLSRAMVQQRLNTIPKDERRIVTSAQSFERAFAD